MRWIIFGAALILGAAPRAQAQITPPTVVLNGRDVENPLPASVAQGSFNTRAYEAILNSVFPASSPAYPKDSLQQVAAERATAWLTRFVGRSGGPILGSASGMFLDNLGKLSVVANRDTDARRYVEQRLSAPDLSLSDQLYTLSSAFSAFAQRDRPDRLAIAKEYLAQIDSYGPMTLGLSLSARASLANIYYKMGIGDSVIHYGVQALEMLPDIPFQRRNFSNSPFLVVADALVPRVNGRAEIDRLGKILLDASWPTDDLIALDSSNLRAGQQNRRTVQANIKTAEMLGNQVPLVVGHFWLNSPNSGYTEQSLADGKIRIVEIGDFHCPFCLEALPAMKRIGDRYANVPKVEVLYVTRTFGFWGIKEASSEEEIAGLKEYYVNKRKLTFPIAIWAPGRAHNDEGDYEVPESPNTAAFFVTGTPRFCIIDGQGRLRRVIQGYSRDLETDLIEVMEFLIKEAKSNAS